MLIELSSPAGRMVIDEHGQINFERAGRTVLRSPLAPAFGLAYSIELPVHLVLDVERHGECVVIRGG